MTEKTRNQIESEMMKNLWSEVSKIHAHYVEGLVTFQEVIYKMMDSMSEGFLYSQSKDLDHEIDEVAREMLGMPSHFEEWLRKNFKTSE
jgi:hypothetical protein